MNVMDLVRDYVLDEEGQRKQKLDQLSGIRNEKLCRLGEMVYAQWKEGREDQQALLSLLYTIDELTGDMDQLSED